MYIWKIEIKLSTQSDFLSGSHLMGIISIHLMIYFLGCWISHVAKLGGTTGKTRVLYSESGEIGKT